MKICSWNINSVRLRAPIVRQVMNELMPDVICLQETKCPNDLFPYDAFQDSGYDHIHINGMKAYNGLVIFSKLPFETQDIFHRVGKKDCRHQMVRIGDVDIHNIYIPAGGDIPDMTENEKFKHKIDFVDEMTSYLSDTYTQNDKVVILGDFNIAPFEHDVWSSKQLKNVVSHTDIERSRIEIMRQSLNFTDSARQFVPMDEKAYSWWSYRNRDWTKSNRGRRLDHIWVTKPLTPLLQSYEVYSDARGWEKPSDHAPIMIELS
jgi:exodeoxyribonuclease-3